MFRLQPNGFHNRDLKLLTAQLRGLDPDAGTAGQMTYDLRPNRPATATGGCERHAPEALAT